MLCLILAGEAIFTLPFHVSRFFGGVDQHKEGAAVWEAHMDESI